MARERPLVASRAAFDSTDPAAASQRASSAAETRCCRFQLNPRRRRRVSTAGRVNSTTNVETSTIEWNFTLGVRRRLLTASGGATLDVVADAIVPVNADQVESTSAPKAPSKSLRGGVIWRP